MRTKPLATAFLLAALLIIAVLGGCSASAMPDYIGNSKTESAQQRTMPSSEMWDTAVSEESYDAEYAPAPAKAAGLDDADIPTAAQGRKIIRTADFTIQTYAFDDDLAAIRARIAGVGGYFESSNINASGGAGSTRYGYMTARVPESQFDNLLSYLRGVETVTFESTNDQDVTQQYVDTQVRVEVLRQSLERLQELQAKSEDIESIIRLQEEMNSVIYSIESYTTDLRHLDAQIEYATVSLNLNELLPDQIITKTDPSLWSRISSTFIRSTSGVVTFLRGLLLLFTALLPVIILLGIAFGIFCLIFRIAAKRWPFKKKKKLPPLSDEELKILNQNRQPPQQSK